MSAPAVYIAPCPPNTVSPTATSRLDSCLFHVALSNWDVNLAERVPDPSKCQTLNWQRLLPSALSSARQSVLLFLFGDMNVDSFGTCPDPAKVLVPYAADRP
jgi:hypothetical protein